MQIINQSHFFFLLKFAVWASGTLESALSLLNSRP